MCSRPIVDLHGLAAQGRRGGSACSAECGASWHSDPPAKHPTDLASVVSGLTTTHGHDAKPSVEPTTYASKRRCTETESTRAVIRPRRSALRWNPHASAAVCLRVLGRCQTCLPPAQGRRGGSACGPVRGGRFRKNDFTRLNSYGSLGPSSAAMFARMQAEAPNARPRRTSCDMHVPGLRDRVAHCY